MDESANRCTIARMCRSADVQAELLLSQFRLHAATRLVRLATAEVSQRGDETIRRACQDVLTTQPPSANADAEAFDPDFVDAAQIVAEIEAATREAQLGMEARE